MKEPKKKKEGRWRGEEDPGIESSWFRVKFELNPTSSLDVTGTIFYFMHFSLVYQIIIILFN